MTDPLPLPVISDQVAEIGDHSSVVLERDRFVFVVDRTLFLFGKEYRHETIYVRTHRLVFVGVRAAERQVGRYDRTRVEPGERGADHFEGVDIVRGDLRRFAGREFLDPDVVSVADIFDMPLHLGRRVARQQAEIDRDFGFRSQYVGRVAAPGPW